MMLHACKGFIVGLLIPPVFIFTFMYLQQPSRDAGNTKPF